MRSGAPPAYDTPQYWEARFAADIASGTHFEWLGSGADTMLPPFIDYLMQSTTNDVPRPAADPSSASSAHPAPTVSVHNGPSAADGRSVTMPHLVRRGSSDQTISPDPIRCLNIGCGSSGLHVTTGAAWRDATLPRRDFWNLDYAASAITAAKQLEPPSRTGETMKYVVGDLLDWHALTRSLVQAADDPNDDTQDDHQESKPVPMFDVILDKSTADSIATGPDIVFGQADNREELLHLLANSSAGASLFSSLRTKSGQSSSPDSSSSSSREHRSSPSPGGSSAANQVHSAVQAEVCCPLFPSNWFALHLPGQNEAFQQYLDWLAAHSSEIDSDFSLSISMRSISLTSPSGSARTGAHKPSPVSHGQQSGEAVATQGTTERRPTTGRSPSGSRSSSSCQSGHPSNGMSDMSLGSDQNGSNAPDHQGTSSNDTQSGSSGGMGCREMALDYCESGSGNVRPDSGSGGSGMDSASSSSKLIHRLEPVAVLAMHLAALVRPGGIWLMMSYSADRCRFLERTPTPTSSAGSGSPPRTPTPTSSAGSGSPPNGNHSTRGFPHPSTLWSLEEKVAFPAPQPTGSATAPPIYHYRYVLRRLPSPSTDSSQAQMP